MWRKECRVQMAMDLTIAPLLTVNNQRGRILGSIADAPFDAVILLGVDQIQDVNQWRALGILLLVHL